MSKVIHESIAIHAPKARVWDVLLKDRTYRLWSAAFAPGSYAQGDWSEGSTMYFKDSDGNGMISKVIKHIPDEIISMEHHGVLEEGKQRADNPETKQWQNFHETYRLAEKDGTAELSVDQDAPDDYYDHLREAWSSALRKIKILCEEADTVG